MTARHRDVALRAFYIWESEGRPDGKALEHWLRAEAECAAELISPRTARRARAKRATLAGTRTGLPRSRPVSSRERNDLDSHTFAVTAEDLVFARLRDRDRR